MKTQRELVLALIELIRNADCIQFDDSPLLTEWYTVPAEILNFETGSQNVICASWDDVNQCEGTLTLAMLLEAMQSNQSHPEKIVFSTDEKNDSSLRFFKLVPVQLNPQSIGDNSDSLSNTCVELALDDPLDILFWDGLPIITRNQLATSHEVNGPFEVLRAGSEEWNYVQALGLVSGSDIFYDRRVAAYEKTGMTRSDAQGVVDMENERGIQPKARTTERELHDGLLAEIEKKASNATPGPWLGVGTYVYALDEFCERNRFYLTVEGGVIKSGEWTKNEELIATAKMFRAAPKLFASNLALIRLLDSTGYERNDPAYTNAIEAAKLAVGIAS